MLEFVNPRRECQGALHGERTVHPGRRTDLGKEIAMSWFVSHVAQPSNRVEGWRSLMNAASVCESPWFLLARSSFWLSVLARRPSDGPAHGRRDAPGPRSARRLPDSSPRAARRCKSLHEKMAGLAAQVLADLDRTIPRKATWRAKASWSNPRRLDTNTPCSPARPPKSPSRSIKRTSSSKRQEVVRDRDQTGPGRAGKRGASHPASQGTLCQVQAGQNRLSRRPGTRMAV